MINKAVNQGKVKSMLGIIITVVMLISLLLSFTASTSIYAAGVTVTRSLPATVSPGQTFNVTVTFTSPAANFNAIGLSDFAPAGWTITANNAWNSPVSDTSNITSNRVDYIWNGPFPISTSFTAVYQVTAPANATPGTYLFTNSSPAPRLEYYIAGTGPFTDNIVGPNSSRILSSAAEFLTYSLPGETGGALINWVTATISVSMAPATDLSNLVAIFSTSALVSSVRVGGVDQISGVTAHNFYTPITYTVTAEDGTTKDWVVTVTETEIVPASSILGTGLLIMVLAILFGFFAFRRMKRSQT